MIGGLAVFLLDRDQPRFRPEQALTGALWTIIVVAIVGFVYEIDYLGGVPGTGGIAAHTALALVAVAIGISFLRPDRGAIRYLRNDDPGARVARTLLPAAVVVPLALDSHASKARRWESSAPGSGLRSPRWGRWRSFSPWSGLHRAA